MNPHEIVLYPLITEKTTNLIEKENKLVFVVSGKATKKDIKWAIEKLYEVEIESINTLNDMDGNKKAHVKLKPEYAAESVATRFGII